MLRLDKLYHSLWKTIEEKKFEALEETKKLESSGWMEEEVDFFIVGMESMLKTEIKLFQYTVDIIYSYNAQKLLGMRNADTDFDIFEHDSVLESEF